VQSSYANSSDEIEIKFTVAFLDADDDKCNGDINTYAPVLLNYRQSEGDDWVMIWNSSDINSEQSHFYFQYLRLFTMCHRKI